MRPLYIDGAFGCRVVLDDPALRIIVPDRADQLFPLSRISRVVCQGSAEWSMQALLACADAGKRCPASISHSFCCCTVWVSQQGRHKTIHHRAFCSCQKKRQVFFMFRSAALLLLLREGKRCAGYKRRDNRIAGQDRIQCGKANR